MGRTGDAGLEGGGAAHEGGGAGLGRGHLGGDDGLGHGVHSEHGHDLLFCFETVFGGAGGRKVSLGSPTNEQINKGSFFNNINVLARR